MLGNTGTAAAEAAAGEFSESSNKEKSSNNSRAAAGTGGQFSESSNKAAAAARNK